MGEGGGRTGGERGGTDGARDGRREGVRVSGREGRRKVVVRELEGRKVGERRRKERGWEER